MVKYFPKTYSDFFSPMIPSNCKVINLVVENTALTTGARNLVVGNFAPTTGAGSPMFEEFAPTIGAGGLVIGDSPPSVDGSK